MRCWSNGRLVVATLAGFGLAAGVSADVDGDGVADGVDVCNNTPAGTAVDATGRPLGDIDGDCDTDVDDFALFQAGFTGPRAEALPGDLVIVEIMSNPGAVSDNSGEWFEILNVSAQTVRLNGLTFADQDADAFTLPQTPVISLAPGERFVLGRASAETNGGVAVDFVYGDAMTLANSMDEIIIRNGATVIDAVVYDDGFWPSAPGAAKTFDGALAPTAAANDDADNWCDAVTAFGAGDFGTPGTTNDVCPTITPPAPGELVIVEIMVDPIAVSDANGEWFEIQNVTTRTLLLSGLTFSDQGSDIFTLPPQIAFEMPPGAQWAFGRAPAGANGGINLVYVFGDQMTLANSGDEIIIRNGTTVIDAVAYDDATWPISSGAAMMFGSNLTATATANDDPGNWCLATTPYQSGDLGTPSSFNGACGP